MLLSAVVFYVAQPLLKPYSASVKKFVEENTSEIIFNSSISDDFTEFVPLANAIGDSRIVMLGEQDHGDAAAFIAKTKIIKFLHERKGFDVLLFESDFYGFNNSTDNYKESIYLMWTGCLECSGLFHYIDSCSTSDNKLIISGVDPRHVSKKTKSTYVVALKHVVDSVGGLTEKEKELLVSVTSNLIKKEYESDVTKGEQKEFLTILDTLRKRFNEGTFWHQEIANLAGFGRSSWDTLRTNNPRDFQMGDNLLWLVNHKFKNRKVIVWAHNFHITRNFRQLPKSVTSGGNDTVSMATMVSNRLINPAELYSIAFIAYSGTAGTIFSNKYELHKPISNFYESWVNELNFKYAFTDLRSFDPNVTNDPKFLMYGTHHDPAIKVNWFNVYDGIFFIQKMFPCTSSSEYVDLDSSLLK